VIITTIRNAFPGHQILSEECGELVQDSQYKWIIDPIDGTVNFAHRIPICCVSIGLEHNGIMVLGGVFNPFLNELFIAERGQGATLNGKAISVSKKASVASACLVTGFPYTYLDEPNGPLAGIRPLYPPGGTGASLGFCCYRPGLGGLRTL
jgi:myo-inositol-1(or 4)-monophosphatase